MELDLSKEKQKTEMDISKRAGMRRVRDKTEMVVMTKGFCQGVLEYFESI